MTIHYHTRDSHTPMVCNSPTCHVEAPENLLHLAPLGELLRYPQRVANGYGASGQLEAGMRHFGAPPVHAVVRLSSTEATSNFVVVTTEAGFILLEALSQAAAAASSGAGEPTLQVSRCTANTLPDAEGYPRVDDTDTIAPVFYAPAVGA